METAPPVLKKERRCKICGAVFEHKAELKAHRRTEHAQEVKANSIDLMPHMLVLGDAKPGKLKPSPHSFGAIYKIIYWCSCCKKWLNQFDFMPSF